jgi:hypothetical protein
VETMQLPEVSLYIYEAGKVRYISAKTRSWEQAEKAAQAERDLWDPEKIALQRIAEGEAAKSAALVAQTIPMGFGEVCSHP